VLSAIGYHQPPVYFLPEFTAIDDHSRRRIEPGGRFRLDEPSLRHRGTWSWTANPFVGTQPFNGLLTVLLVFNSWDLKDSNNSLYDVGGRPWYVVRDLGGALGEEGRMRPKRNDVNRFERGDFIKDVAGGCIEFAYKGKRSSLIDGRIPVEDASWAMRLLSGLSDRQWRDAFRAGGYPPSVAARFINKIRARIQQGLALDSLPHEQSRPHPPPRRP
jgi:hypothetical protein